MNAKKTADACGVSKDALRYYERMRLLPPPARTPSGYRMYGLETVQRVHLIRRAQELGFRLVELREILRVRDQGGIPCAEVRQLGEAKLSALEHQILELRARRNRLRRVLRTWDAQLAAARGRRPAHLLESLPPQAVMSSESPVR